MTDTRIKILYEDNHVIAVEKPAGVLTQGDITGEEPLLDQVKEYIRDRYAKPGRVFLGLVHRLDKPVSGIVVFARTSKAAGRLFRDFSGRSAVKLYLALVHRPQREPSGGDQGGLPWVEMEQDLGRGRGVTFIAREGGRSQKAKLAYRVMASNEKYSLLLVHLLTGRKHQIRAQLSSIGMPVAGDGKYGSGERFGDGSIGLHACFLRFLHPTKKVPVDIVSGVPERISSRIECDFDPGAFLPCSDE